MCKKGLMFYIFWVMFLVYSKIIFRTERFLYKKLNNKKIKRRIFLSSGNISLINLLTIIKQFPEENCEDILIIDTPLGKKEFFDINLKVAELHNFKKIILFKNKKDDRIFYEFMRQNIFAIDEVYAHTKFDYIRFIFPMFKDCKIVMFDEGFGSLIELYHPNNKYISCLNTVKYCDKFDRLGWDNVPITHPDVSIFRQIAKDISEKYPFDINISPESKTIMFCGGYWQAFEMGKDEFYEYQNGIMQKLIDNGFDVIYKPHPRDGVDIKPPEGVKVTNCRLPLELYKLDILAVAAVSSFISLQEYHYWNVPGFSDINEKTFPNVCGEIRIIRHILREYAPNITELLNIKAGEYSKEELRSLLLKIFKRKFDNQPLLSENKIVGAEYEKYTNELKSRF